MANTIVKCVIGFVCICLLVGCAAWMIHLYTESTNDEEGDLQSSSTHPLWPPSKHPPPPSMEFRHHHNSELTDLLIGYERSFPNLAHHYRIGRSVENRYLEAIEITDNPGRHEPGEPEIKLVGNIHGNEVVGRELLLYFIDYLLKNYEYNQTIRTLVDNVRLHILPSMNPDGYSRAVENDCSGTVGRENANQVDLNRNFPDQFVPQKPSLSSLEPETQSVINWTRTYPFVLSAAMHGGALVVNYPFDSNVNSANRYTASPDDNVFRYMALLYSQAHPQMKTGKCKEEDKCKLNDFEVFEKGITNGAAWYPISGGMQDWNYVVANCFELTIELGCAKYPNSKELQHYWDDNLNSMIRLINAVHLGVSGFVFDQSGTPLVGATIFVAGIRKNVTTQQMGDYWRLLTPGAQYTITALKENFQSSSQVIFINKDKGYQFKLNFTLRAAL